MIEAIRFESVDEVHYGGKRITLKRPYVVDELCIGYGISEYVCTVEEKAGGRGLQEDQEKTVARGALLLVSPLIR